MKKIVFFDFDGVICNSFDLAHRTSSTMFDIPLSAEEYRGFFEGNIFERTPGKHVRKPGLTRVDYHDRYNPHVIKQDLFEGVPAAIEAIHANYPSLYIVSSAEGGVVRPYLELHGLLPYFKEVKGSEAHLKKTIKMEEILAAEGVLPEDAVIITDTLGDIREAGSIGVGSIAVTWGYHDTERLIQGNPHVIIESPEHLPKAVDEYFARP